MHKSESIQENETRKILWDVETQTHHLILARRSDLVIIQKKKKNINQKRVVSANHREKESPPPKKKQVLRSWQRTEKIAEHEGDGNANCN